MAQRLITHKGPGKRRMVFRVLEFFCLGILSLILLLAIGFLSVFIYYAKDLPRPEKFTERTFVQSTKIYDRTGQVLLYEMYGDEKREVIPLSLIPERLKQALISAEDAKFYSHHGVDFKAIVRSIMADLKLKKPVYGASTISQQLIRSTFLTQEKTAERKIREIILTLEMERRYSKDQILEWYLNQVPFGPNIYGVETAAKTFFGKPAKDLNLNESATLASLVQSPVYLSPYGAGKDKLITRKNYVLDRMVQENYLKKEEAEATKKEELKFAEPITTIKAPHFVFYVQDYLLEKYGKEFLEKGGLKIFTTLDWDLEQMMEKIVIDGVKKNKKYNAYNAAMVSIDPKTGEILTMVGSTDWFAKPYPEGCAPGINCLFDPKVNVATFNPGRQPGSAFKPFVYATAFEKRVCSDKTVVIDEETNFGIYGGKPYIPHNYDGYFRGPVTLRSALGQSLNVPSVKVLAYYAGLADSVRTAQKMGITTLNDPKRYGLSIVLGGGEVKLLDMTSAFGVFAADGMRMPASAILKIEDLEGNIIEENKKTPKRIISSQTAELINDILSDPQARQPAFGPNAQVMYFEGYQVAVKTGTTSDFRDGWIIGYTPSIVVGAWAGNSNNAPMREEPGVVIIGHIWRDFMEKMLLKLPNETFLKPESLSSQ